MKRKERSCDNAEDGSVTGNLPFAKMLKCLSEDAKQGEPLKSLINQKCLTNGNDYAGAGQSTDDRAQHIRAMQKDRNGNKCDTCSTSQWPSNPVIAGNLAKFLGEDVTRWIAIAAIESAPDTSQKGAWKIQISHKRNIMFHNIKIDN